MSTSDSDSTLEESGLLGGRLRMPNGADSAAVVAEDIGTGVAEEAPASRTTVAATVISGVAALASEAGLSVAALAGSGSGDTCTVGGAA